MLFFLLICSPTDAFISTSLSISIYTYLCIVLILISLYWIFRIILVTFVFLTFFFSMLLRNSLTPFMEKLFIVIAFDYKLRRNELFNILSKHCLFFFTLQCDFMFLHIGLAHCQIQSQISYKFYGFLQEYFCTLYILVSNCWCIEMLLIFFMLLCLQEILSPQF